jgi:hypothetical protein
MPHNHFPALQIADREAALSLKNARSPFVKNGIAYWQSLCGVTRFPARTELALRGMAPFLPLTVIVGVVGGGADYEYRYVGEAQRLAFGAYFKGMRVTQIEASIPPLGALLRGVYEMVRSTGTPMLIQGEVAHEAEGSLFRYHETVFLPLGAGGCAVDHLLIVGVQVPKPFWDVPEEKLKVLVKQSAAPHPVS